MQGPTKDSRSGFLHWTLHSSEPQAWQAISPKSPWQGSRFLHTAEASFQRSTYSHTPHAIIKDKIKGARGTTKGPLRVVSMTVVVRWRELRPVGKGASAQTFLPIPSVLVAKMKYRAEDGAIGSYENCAMQHSDRHFRFSTRLRYSSEDGLLAFSTLPKRDDTSV